MKKGKRIIFLVMAMLLSGATLAMTKNVKIKGRVPRYINKGVLLLIDEKTRHYDTVKVSSNGKFTHTLTIEEPVIKSLNLEYLADDRGAVRCYLLPGKHLEVTVTGKNEAIDFGTDTLRFYQLTPTFKGATSKECEYLNLPSFPAFIYCHYTDAQGNALSYRDFLQQIARQQADRKHALEATRKEFSAGREREFDTVLPEWGFVYAWQLLRRGLNPDEDPDFTAFVDSIDLNNEQTAPILITDKIRYILRRDSALYQNEPEDARFLRYLSDHVTNANIRERLSDERMKRSMVSGGGKDLDKVWELYKQLSGSSETFKRNAEIYQSLSQLNAGTEAADFTMQDTEGDSVRFHDVIKCGKITYIDFWATWCGPCCAEIPYVEALVEHYKDNPRIQFVSISLDHNLDKWHEKLERDKPSWAQYIIPDNFNSKFAKEYNIRAIPRFMIFDGEGRIITIDAARPSSSSIKEILNEYIK